MRLLFLTSVLCYQVSTRALVPRTRFAIRAAPARSRDGTKAIPQFDINRDNATVSLLSAPQQDTAGDATHHQRRELPAVDNDASWHRWADPHFAVRYIDTQDTIGWHVRIATGPDHTDSHWSSGRTSSSAPAANTPSFRRLSPPKNVPAVPNIAEKRPPIRSLIYAMDLRRADIPVLVADAWRTVESKARSYFTVDYLLSPRMMYAIFQEIYGLHYSGRPEPWEHRGAPVTLQEFLAVASALDLDIVADDNGAQRRVLNPNRGAVPREKGLWRVLNDASGNADGVSIDLAVLKDKLLLHFTKYNIWLITGGARDDADAETTAHLAEALHDLTYADAAAAFDYLRIIESRFLEAAEGIANFLAVYIMKRLPQVDGERLAVEFYDLAKYRMEFAGRVLGGVLGESEWKWRHPGSVKSVDGRVKEVRVGK